MQVLQIDLSGNNNLVTDFFWFLVFSDEQKSNTTEISGYKNKGINYKGNVNVTLIGKVCVEWFENSYLDEIEYPALVNNFCRNPEGYGLKPWCYVNMTSREWEYCNADICGYSIGVTGRLN